MVVYVCVGLLLEPGYSQPAKDQSEMFCKFKTSCRR
jgi:hypothetical protein